MLEMIIPLAWLSKVLHFYVDMKILFKLVIIFDQVKLDKIRCNIAEGFDCNVWEIAHIFHTVCIRSMAISRLHKLIVYTNIEMRAVLLSTLQCNTYKFLRCDPGKHFDVQIKHKI